MDSVSPAGLPSRTSWRRPREPAALRRAVRSTSLTVGLDGRLKQVPQRFTSRAESVTVPGGHVLHLSPSIKISTRRRALACQSGWTLS
jgi:hypothetical protein